MCWSAKVSLQTFLFSTVPLVLCYYYKLIPLSHFITFQTFVSMQLLEYFLWTYLNTPWNSFLSKIGLFLIILLPFNTIVLSTIPYKWHVLGVYLLFVGMVLSFCRISFHTSIAKNNHLSWDWLKLPIPTVLLWGLFYLIPNLNRLDMIALFSFSTFWITIYTYYNTNTYGSMWCWIANFCSIYFYFLLARYFL